MTNHDLPSTATKLFNGDVVMTGLLPSADACGCYHSLRHLDFGRSVQQQPGHPVEDVPGIPCVEDGGRKVGQEHHILSCQMTCMHIFEFDA